MNNKVTLTTSGSLNLKSENVTLADVEAFCAKARELGLSDQAPLRPFRQGLMGPTVGWHFIIPVEPVKMTSD